jgi:hypothetical protein
MQILYAYMFYCLTKHAVDFACYASDFKDPRVLAQTTRATTKVHANLHFSIQHETLKYLTLYEGTHSDSSSCKATEIMQGVEHQMSIYIGKVFRIVVYPHGAIMTR